VWTLSFGCSPTPEGELLRPYLDLMQQSLPEAYDCVDGTLDADFWPACPADEMPALATETLPYDPATDSWSK